MLDGCKKELPQLPGKAHLLHSEPQLKWLSGRTYNPTDGVGTLSAQHVRHVEDNLLRSLVFIRIGVLDYLSVSERRVDVEVVLLHRITRLPPPDPDALQPIDYESITAAWSAQEFANKLCDSIHRLRQRMSLSKKNFVRSGRHLVPPLSSDARPKIG